MKLAGDPETLCSVQIKSPVRIREKSLLFLREDITLSIQDACVWSPPEPIRIFLSGKNRSKYLKEIQSLVEKKAPAVPANQLLPVLMEKNFRNESNVTGYPSLLCSLQLACKSQESEQVTQALSAFLGLGNGLTPSGDDLVIGFLLALNRWGTLIQSDLEVQKINLPILEKAENQTNTISANLVKCACAGHADERLILALDGLISGNIDPEKCTSLLSRWGNTSGYDALVGMAVFSQDFLCW